jgi:hypothetical protein
LFLRDHKIKNNITFLNIITNKMMSIFNVLSTTMLDRVFSQINITSVITKYWNIVSFKTKVHESFLHLEYLSIT